METVFDHITSDVRSLRSIKRDSFVSPMTQEEWRRDAGAARSARTTIFMLFNAFTSGSEGDLLVLDHISGR